MLVFGFSILCEALSPFNIYGVWFSGDDSGDVFVECFDFVVFGVEIIFDFLGIALMSYFFFDQFFMLIVIQVIFSLLYSLEFLPVVIVVYLLRLSEPQVHNH